MQEDFLDKNQKLVTTKGELRTSLDRTKKEREQLQMELTETIFIKLHDLKKEKD